MKCTSCQHDNAPGVNFCAECGSRMSLLCPACGRASLPSAKFCVECGEKLTTDLPALASPRAYTPTHLAQKILTHRATLEGERKQVTVLFCDIANSTAIATRIGPEAMHALLQMFFEACLVEVHRYEGTINQFLGDGFMALFGAPLAHEDHARRAVLAAIDLRRAVAEVQRRIAVLRGDELRVRIGLHTGPVVVGSIGDNLRMDYTAIGDTTHLAARLQQIATPGQILASDVTMRLVVGYFDAEPLTPVSLKGIGREVQPFALTAVGSRRSRIDLGRALSPFVGRTREFAMLKEVLELAIGGMGQVLSIVGEPGTGKSRMLHELRQFAAGQGLNVHEGWCLSFGTNSPYLPMIDLLRQLCGIADSDDADTASAKLALTLQEFDLSDRDLGLLLSKLLGVGDHRDVAGGLGPDVIQSRTIAGVVRLMLAQARRGPMVLAVEDLHWIDKVSEACLAALVESIGGVPLLLVTTCRSGYAVPWSTRSYATQVTLRVLPPEASRQIVIATTQRATLSDTSLDAILRKAEGNPLFLEELSLALSVGSSGEDGLPDTIQGVLAARIDRLPDDVKRTLQTASVLGREFDLSLLDAIADHGSDTRNHLEYLKKGEFLYERQESDGPAYTFKHVLTQEVAYESLLTGRRRALHELAGRAIEALHPGREEEYCERLAFHFARSDAADRALHFLTLANRKAASANAMAAARSYFEEAMQVLDRLPDDEQHRVRRISLLSAQVHAYVLTNGLNTYDQYLRTYGPVADLLEDRAVRGQFLASRGHCDYVLGRSASAVATLREAAALCEEAENFHGAAHAYAHLQWTYLQRGEFEQVLRYEPASMRTLAHAADLRLEIYALTASAWALAAMGAWSESAERGRAALVRSEACGDPSLIAFSEVFGISTWHRLRCDAAGAAAAARRALDVAPTPADRSWAANYLAWAETETRPDSAIGILEPTMRAHRREGSDWMESLAGLPLGEAYLRAGRLDEARQTLERVVAIADPLEIRLLSLPARRLLAETLLAMGRDDELSTADDLLKVAMAHLERTCASVETSNARSTYAAILERRGDTESASKMRRLAGDALHPVRPDAAVN